MSGWGWHATGPVLFADGSVFEEFGMAARAMDAAGTGSAGTVARVLVTSGPTWEPIDAVRYVGNRSSGRVGAAIADAACVAGYEVTALLGPGGIEPTETRVRVDRFRTAEDLAGMLTERTRAGAYDALVMAAAVADFRPVRVEAGKVRRGGGLVVEMEPVPDVIAGVARELGRLGEGDVDPLFGSGGGVWPLLVGFALEPGDGLAEAARAKMVRKGLDAVVANPLETMEGDEIEAVLVWREGNTDRTGGGVAKRAFGAWLIERLSGAIAASVAARPAGDVGVGS